MPVKFNNLVDGEYLHTVRHVLDEGTWQKDRTSVGRSKQLFGQNIYFDTKDKNAPFIQCRTFAPRLSFHEWQWMMRGITDSKWLESYDVYIWQPNTTREFLDARGLHSLAEGEIGPAYGKQFRDFGGVDQLSKVFHQIKYNPTSRRHVISLWNVPELDKAALEPCAYLYEFMVEGGKLHIHQHMRSADIVFGVPYNLSFSYYFLKSFADALGYKTGSIWLSMTNCHIYENQIDIAEDMVAGYGDTVSEKEAPEVVFTKDLTAVGDITSMDWSDVEITNWERGPKIGNAKMAV